MYICIYIYVYMYICIYVYMYICIYVYMHIYICIYVYMCICVYLEILHCTSMKWVFRHTMYICSSRASDEPKWHDKIVISLLHSLVFSASRGRFFGTNHLSLESLLVAVSFCPVPGSDVTLHLRKGDSTDPD